MKDWKKELKKIENGEGTYRQHLSKYEQLEWLIETLLQEEREKVVEDMKWGLKKYYEEHTWLPFPNEEDFANSVGYFLEEYLSKKGEGK